VAVTFLGAHAVPTEYKSDPNAFIELVIEEMLPAVQTEGWAEFCDVFCEEGVFSLEQSRRLLGRAKDMGFGLKIHADEVNQLGGAGLAAELKATSADHLLAASDQDLTAMARSGVVGVLLPATAYSLKKSYARARDMIGLGVPVALATDANPGSSFTESMPFVFGLAVMNMNMTVGEALTGATLNAAYALGRADRVGSLDPGKYADFLLLDGQTPAILAYHAGVSPVEAVYKRGELVHPARRPE
jgi:imidazolonepropionase